MKIEIIGEPIALCSVNMKQFKVDYKTTLNLRDSIEKNFNVDGQRVTLSKEDLLKYVWFGLDWGNILRMIHLVKSDKMDIRFFEIEYKDKIEYTPDKLTMNSRTFELREERKSGKDVLMINNFIPSPNADLKAYMDFTTFNSGGLKWRVKE